VAPVPLAPPVAPLPPVTVKVVDLEPAEEGVKVTVKVAVPPPAAIVVGDSAVVITNWGSELTTEMPVAAPVPVLVMV